MWDSVGQRVIGLDDLSVFEFSSSNTTFTSFSYNALPPPSEFGQSALESRFIASYLAAASLVVLASQSIFAVTRGPRQITVSAPSSYVACHGGLAILPFQAVRFISNGALFSLLVLTSLTTHAWGDVTLTLTSAYGAVLSALLLVVPVANSRTMSFHATWSSLAIFGVYCYRDIWPLVTFVFASADGGEGWLLWTKVAFAGVAAIIVPVCEPFPYIPLDPEDPQSIAAPSQTAPLISFVTYSFLEPLLWEAYRTGHLGADRVPPLIDTDRTSVVKESSFPYLDPCKLGRGKVSVVWGLLMTFRWSWLAQVGLLMLDSLCTIAGPVGLNHLLSYAETNGSGAVVVRPFVWIIWIGLAPLLQNLFIEWFLFLNSRVSVLTDSAITALVFTHALRARLINKPEDGRAPEPYKAVQLSKPRDDTDPTTEVTLSIESAQVPEDQSAGEDSQVDFETMHSRAESSATAASTLGPAANGDNGRDAKQAKKADRTKHTPDLLGRLDNLVTGDLQSIGNAKSWPQLLVRIPLLLGLGSWFLYSILGWSTWVGLAVMVALIPVPAWVSSLLNGVQEKKMAATDERVKTVKEVLGVLRMVKQFGWEGLVKGQLEQKRKEELKWILRYKVLDLLNLAVDNVIPLCHMIVTFIIYTVVQKQRLTASVVFSALAGFNMIRNCVFTVMHFVPTFIRAKVSIDRLQEFLNDTELLDRYAEDVVVNDASSLHENDLGIAQASFSWYKETDDMLPSSRMSFRLRIEDVIMFRQGALNLIVGPTGSGKTSLLQALLGEMHYLPSGPGAWLNVPRRQGVAYCAQESWIQSLSIKDNILFGAAYDKTRYNKAIYQCGLKRDLSLFNAGDLTEVGEKGLTLSGGQKARIALARAVYSSASTLLLDDIFAALDIHTAVWIANKCFKGDLLKGRTVVLVTHNVALTAPLADFVVSMSTDGRIANQGRPSEIVLKDQSRAEEIAQETEAIELGQELEGDEDENNEASAQGAKLIVEEELQQGHISWKAMSLYLPALSPYPAIFWVAYLVGRSISEGSEILEMWWLGHFADAYSSGGPVDVAYYLGVYGGIIGFCVMTYCYCSGLIAIASVRASRVVHSRLMDSILASTFRWLDVTPSSRIMTRCTQDIQSVDEPLSELIDMVLSSFTMVTSRLLAIAVSAPSFILPGLLMGATGFTFGQFYMKAQLSVKRERSNAKSPVLAAVNGTFAGLVTIRAFNAEMLFSSSCDEKIDAYTRLSRVFWDLNRWVSVRTQLLSSMFSSGLAWYLIYGTNKSASTIGFTLNMAFAFSGPLLWLVRLLNNLKVEANSLERIQSYLDIEKEIAPREGGKSPAAWPTSGDLRVEKLVARYSADGPVVLNNVSFHIKSGERVGVVGRTGSGKSTLTLALLRCILTEGDVYYDGVPIASLNLDELRSKITIIPQSPELMTGTLRKNLDMFSTHEDAELNDALRAAGLFSLQSESDENRLALDSQIAAGGGNLSVGQRQIIALARAIVRQSKCLILDEATSAIDYETDAIIQASLRTELKRDVTIITIAHRLQTVMDSDKILVLDAGELVEFDSPKALLQKEGSFLRALVDESSDREQLYAMAAGHPSS